MESRRFVVSRPRMLKELRHFIRDDAARAGIWPKVKSAIDGVTVGERGSVVLIEQKRDGQDDGITAIAIIGYREELGTTPKIRITPRIDLRLSQPVPPHPGSFRSDAVLELTSKVTEVRVAAKASGSDCVEIQVIGTDDFAVDIRETIRGTAKTSPGAAILLDGELIEPSMADHDWDMVESKGTCPLCVLLEEWDASDADRFNDPNFRKEIQANRHLELAPVSAWFASLDPSGDVIALSDQEVGSGDSDEIVCHLREVTDAVEYRKRLRKAGVAPHAIQSLFGMASSAIQGKGEVSIATIESKEGRLLGVSAMSRMLAVKELTPERAHVAYCVLAMPFYTDVPKLEMSAKAAGMMMEGQVRCDLDDLAENLLEFSPSVQIDVVAVGIDKGSEMIDTIIDGIGETVDIFHRDGPEEIDQGEVILRLMPSEMLGRMRLKLF